MPASFEAAADLAAALQRAADAHGHHEAKIGHPGRAWPDWSAGYMVQEAGPSGRARPWAATDRQQHRAQV